jgi:hypothetical protein
LLALLPNLRKKCASIVARHAASGTAAAMMPREANGGAASGKLPLSGCRGTQGTA